MLTVATLLWDPNGHSENFSRCYDESWVEKLYRGVARNLTLPFQFRCFVDRRREFKEPAIRQSILRPGEPSYASCVEPYCLNQPMILVGLDTIILKNIDHLAEYCLNIEKGGPVALPRDPYHWSRACTGVALVPAGNERIYLDHRGENDMDWLRAQPHVFIDDLWPRDVVSYKGFYLGQTREYHEQDEEKPPPSIVYFHGVPKMHEMAADDPLLAHWK